MSDEISDSLERKEKKMQGATIKESPIAGVIRAGGDVLDKWTAPPKGKRGFRTMYREASQRRRLKA